MYRSAPALIGLALAAGLSTPLGVTAAGAAEPEANQPPLAPTEVGFGVSYAGCDDFVPSLPDMSSRLTDPDGDTMSANYRLARVDNGSWTGLGSKVVQGVASGSIARTFIDPALAQTPDGSWRQTKFRFTVGAVEAVGEQFAGPRSAPCDFILDTTNPKLTVVNPVATLPGGGSTPLPAGDAIPRGSELQMTLDPAGSNGYGGVNDVDYYRWGIDGDSTSLAHTVDPAMLGSKHALKIDTTDLSSGPHRLIVRAYDRAGRMSEPWESDYFFISGADHHADYAFDEGATAPVARDGLDDGSRASTFNLTGGAGHSVNVPDQNFNLSLDGASGTAVSGSPVVRPPVSARTRALSFGAWARPSDVAGRRVLVSQVTSVGQVYTLGIEPCATGGGACAFFTLRNPETGKSYTARSTVKVRVDTWVYLAGSFNDFTPKGRRIQVWAQYPGAGQTVRTTWLPATFKVPSMGTGHTRIGSELAGPTAASYWSGHVEDLRFFHGAVNRHDVRVQMLMAPEGPA